MARSRNIKPSFFINDELFELCFAARLLFIGLWTMADREGLLEDRPKRIKVALFPADTVDVDALLDDLAAAGLVDRYQVEGARYIHIVKFLKHQHPHHKEALSVIPKPGLRDDMTQDSLSFASVSPQTDPSDSFNLIPDSLNLIPDPFNLIPDVLIDPLDGYHTAGLGQEWTMQGQADGGVEAVVEGRSAVHGVLQGALQEPLQQDRQHAVSQNMHHGEPLPMLGALPKARLAALNIPFETFWDLYDKKVQPKACEKKWRALSDAEREEIMTHVPLYKQAQPDKAFRKNPETYLHQRSWHDEIIHQSVMAHHGSTQHRSAQHGSAWSGRAQGKALSAWDQYFANAGAGTGNLIDVSPQARVWGGGYVVS